MHITYKLCTDKFVLVHVHLCTNKFIVCIYMYTRIMHNVHVLFIGAIEVSIATMSKAERAKTTEVYVSGFVPSYALPNKRPISLDPFICPLIEEVEEYFINGILIGIIMIALINNYSLGIEVQYNAEVAGIPPGKALLRCLILLWTSLESCPFRKTRVWPTAIASPVQNLATSGDSLLN